ncbi:hypothetical protein Cflav_PD1540 [Pedosphaera parvula Ellin514]|uniref:Uncharacterized protein n=1 Tax=Pedosphaera parvula (strain Ellin514) TaxID=320771 RepID=B9XNI0_PEDPL|nr:hypothetical protein Cflav_PD1540 [Pedosphaera parvula Ellin514]
MERAMMRIKEWVVNYQIFILSNYQIGTGGLLLEFLWMSGWEVGLSRLKSRYLGLSRANSC